MAQNTIVVYVADQGYFLGEHGFFDKRMFYEEAARMPFVIRYLKQMKKEMMQLRRLMGECCETG